MSYFPTTASPPRARENDEQAPLGESPTYDEVLDVAVQYTFPCSDPIAVEACCAELQAREQREEGQPGGPGMGHGDGQALPL